MRSVVADKGLSGCDRSVLFGLLARASVAFGQDFAGHTHRAAESLRIAMALAPFFSAVLREAQSLTLAPLLQRGLAVESDGVPPARQHWCVASGG